MEKKILKESTRALNGQSKPLSAIHSPRRFNKENEKNFSPDLHPIIKNISVKSNEITFLHLIFIDFLSKIQDLKRKTLKNIKFDSENMCIYQKNRYYLFVMTALTH